MSFCIFQVTLGYFGIRYTPIFSEANSKESEDLKYKKTGLSPEMAQLQFTSLEAYMADNQPYLDPELTLSDLAGQLQLSPNHLSQIINQFTKTNFFTYINAYRIQEVSKLLADPTQEPYSILGLAYEAGFKSKSVFNALFKKTKGMTPSVYRKSHGTK